ncbi:hypothetical protein ABT001_32200 [Streptomyces sp. NPDC002793]|uniref:hypothetical protein n=1 Tax=Streptomyces sp. NPDC002793 TaxID=3154432 RepID=UPI003323DB27
MEFWQNTIGPYEGRLEDLDSATLTGLALHVIERTVPLFEPPFEELFPAEYATLIASAVPVRGHSLAHRPIDDALARNFLAGYDVLPEVPIRPAVGPFMMALVRLFEAAEGSVSAYDTLAILWSCYEAVLMSQLSGRIAEDDEKANPCCRRAIALQEEAVLDRLRAGSAPPS